MTPHRIKQVNKTARATASAIGALGACAASIRADVAKPVETRRLLTGTVRRLGRG